MAENKNVGFLKIVLIIFAVISIVYGIGYFLFPNFLVNLSGDTPVFHGWLRWSGGVLIALGEGIFVTTMALGCLLIGIALLWAWITVEEGTNVWFTALPTVLGFVLAILLWLSRAKAKDILYPKKD
jgi:hypothetical protein